MKIRTKHIFLILFLAFASPAGIYCVNAQDASYPMQDSFEEVEPERDKVISPGEADPMNSNKTQVSVPKESVPAPKASTTQSTNSPADEPKTASKPTAQEDDSNLSFNFLYYLFEKYKLQDIVD